MPQLWYVGLLITAGAFTYVSACTCAGPQPTVQQHFCNSQFSSVFKIKNNGTAVPSGSGRVYEVERLRQYRTTDLDSKPDVTKLYTTYVDGSFCGVTFVPEAYYLVTGYYRKVPGQEMTQMWTNFCNFQKYYEDNPLETFVAPQCNTTKPDIKTDQEPI
ncbi:uncharacterized protein LOC128552432 isoform X2 [Mercenaria mercenaria]|uniref:uncharacterized protein LOC128552432 isoform X2 n=1 Tax=Mercenaria mercenaria TaxID=6596 RepID=UPI00234EFB26|nr:uncharacterized protein LOC128552432 isoform X2 [Mercenaria mercenaria]